MGILNMLKTILLILQIAVPILLIGCILMQQRGAALGSAFGGSGAFYLKRRGAEQKLFYATVALGTMFLIVSLLNLIV